MTAADKTESLNLEEALTDKKERDITDVTGQNGRWQLSIFMILFCLSLPGAGQNLAISFTAPDLDYWCTKSPEISNTSAELWKKLPLNNKQCFRYTNLTFPMDGTREFNAVPCDSWEFDHSVYTSTLVEEFDLVCDREWLISFSRSIFMIGLLVSGISGYVADKIGRRWTITISCWITFFSSVTCAFSTSFTMFLVARFFVAIGVGGYYNNLHILLMEVLGPNKRGVYGNAVNLGWCFGFVCLPGVVWLIKDWFWIQIAITLPYFVFLGVWWMITESPRWLLSKGRTEEAKEVLIKASKMNGKNIPDIDKAIEEILIATRDNYESGETDGNVLDLLRAPGLWQITLNILFSWFVISFIYYGLTFNTNELAGDPFVNFAASGAAEFPACFLSIFAIQNFGRRKSIAATMIAGGLICLSSHFLPTDPKWVRMAVPVIGKFFITACYGVIYVFSSELFPTVVRSSGLGLTVFSEQVASIIAPFMRELGIATEPSVPYILYGILATASGLLTTLLPETTNRKVPDTIKEAISFSKFVISFIYYGLTFNTNELAGDPFVNFAASGAVEFPACFLSIFAIQNFGRRKSIAGTMIAGGLICLSSHFLPTDPKWIRMAVPVIGKLFITACYGIIYVFSSELFPTVVRSSGLGLISFSEQVASIIAPFMRELGTAIEPSVPYILYGVLATASGLLTLLLPETTNRKVPDTIKEAISLSK